MEFLLLRWDTNKSKWLIMFFFSAHSRNEIIFKRFFVCFQFLRISNQSPVFYFQLEQIKINVKNAIGCFTSTQKAFKNKVLFPFGVETWNTKRNPIFLCCFATQFYRATNIRVRNSWNINLIFILFIICKGIMGKFNFPHPYTLTYCISKSSLCVWKIMNVQNT